MSGESKSWKERFYEKEKEKVRDKEQSNGKLGEGKNRNSIVSKSKKSGQEILMEYRHLNFLNEINKGFTAFFKLFHKNTAIFLPIVLLWSLIGLLLFTPLDWQLINTYWTFWARFNVFPGDPIPSMEGLPLTNEDKLLIIQTNQYMLLTSTVEGFFYFIPFIIASMFAARLISMHLIGESESISNSIKAILTPKKLRITVLLAVINSLLVGFGISMMIIPGILFLMLLGNTFFIHSNEDVGLKETFTLSFKRSEGFRFKLFFIILLGYIVMLFFSNELYRLLIMWFRPDIFQASANEETYQLLNYNMLAPNTRDWGALITLKLFYFGTQALFFPLTICFLAVIYTEAYARENDTEYIRQKEEERKARELEIEMDNEMKKLRKKGKDHIARVIKPTGKPARYYCPQCGERILPKKNQTTVRCGKCNFEVHIPPKT